MSSATSEWGEEVLPGVHVMRRTHNPHVAIAQLAQEAQRRGAPVMLEMNYEKIHKDMSALRDLMRRLRSTNKYLEKYLHERAGERSSTRSGASDVLSEPTAVGLDDDEVVREALAENMHLLIVKQRELDELKQLTRLQPCSHDHSADDHHEHCSHHHEHHSSSSHASSTGSGSDDSRAEESSSGSHDEESGEASAMQEGAMCMAQLSNAAAVRSNHQFVL